MTNEYNRLDYWNQGWNDLASSNLLLDYPYLKSVSLNEDIMDQLRELSFDLIVRSFSDNSITESPEVTEKSKIISILNKTSSFTIKKDLDSYVKIENILVKYLEKNGLIKNCVGMEFPINLRVIHSSPAEWLMNRTYITHRVHCDPWAGDPGDCIHCFFYIYLDETSSTLEFLLPDERDLKQFEAYTGLYEDAYSLVEHLKPLKYKAEIGQFILFDSFVPHWTKLGTGSVRISIDFRLRCADPYAILDEGWTRQVAPWSRFWYIANDPVETYAERYQKELESLNKKGLQKAAEFRCMSSKPVLSAIAA